MKIFFHLIVLAAGSLVLICDSQTPGCELPTVLQGSWAMTRFGLANIGFNTTHVTQFPIDNSSCAQCSETYDFYCYSKTGTQYVFKSLLYAPLGGLGSEYSMYMCLDLVAIDSSTVLVHELTTLGSFGASNRIKHASKSSTTVPASCNLDTASSNHGLLLQLNSLDGYSKMCPADILGRYVDQTSSCTLDIDVCTDNTTIAVSNIKSNCSAKPLFTDGSSVKCLHGEVKGTTTYLTVYHNNTGVTATEPFTCLAIQKSGDLVKMSQNPLNCLSNQTAVSSTDLGNLTFSFSPIELCPILNDTTTSPGLEPGAIAGIVVGVLLLLLLLILVIVLVCCCLSRKRRRKEHEKEVEERNASDRQPIREPDDAVSVDSGCPTVPAVHFIDDENDNRHAKRKTKKPKRRHRKIRRKRRILGPNGEIIYEESNPGEDSDKDYSDDFEDEDEEVTGDQEPVKNRKLKRRVRNYTRERIGSSGQVITEEVESEYYETDSDGSVESWQLDPVRVKIHKARENRKQFIDKFGYDPLFQAQSILTRKENDLRFQPERMKTTKDILKSAGKTKQKKLIPGQISDDSLSNEDRKTPFLEKYEYKISMDKRFEDEGFWDDAANKKTAKDIFELDKLDARLDGKNEENSGKKRHMNERNDVSETESLENIDISGESAQKDVEPSSSAVKSASDSSLASESVISTVIDVEPTAGWTEQGTNDVKSQKEQKRSQSAIRHLLTERLFGTRRDGDRSSSNKTRTGFSAKMGNNMPKVILVNEYNESADLNKAVLSTHKNNLDFPPIKDSILPGLPPVSTSFPLPSPSVSSQSSMLADGLDKDKRYIKQAKKSHIQWFKTDYGGGNDRRFEKNIDDQQKMFELVPGPHHSVLPSVSRREVNMDGQITPISHTSSSRHVDVLSMSEWRLRKLLEELYKDKKYMDGLLDKQGKPVHVKELAHYGRDYLLQVADFWESKGMLPPRPHQTLPGAMTPKRPKSSTSLNVHLEETDEDASRPTLPRNKSMC